MPVPKQQAKQDDRLGRGMVRVPALLFLSLLTVACGGEEKGLEPMQEIAAKPKHTNRLINETSPYLLQHAHNPVDWYPWGEEAFEKARAENKPIFLSIGYSACHWCHVMERESFENEAIAALLNEHFVSIKVDREERPDLDDIYMTAVTAMTGSGGWPMSVFLTQDLKPFYGGTYFPPESGFGRPGFSDLLNGIAKAWDEKRDEIVESASGISEHVAAALSAPAQSGAVDSGLIRGALQQLKATFDENYGGWGGAPKFPSSSGIALLLRAYARSGDPQALRMAAETLDKMARGGMYDHLGGGFHRYSVDAQWLVPHFEKMLYDNGQLSQVYVEAYQLTGNPLYEKVAREIFDYEIRDMQSPAGAFYSTEDADSEGEEGKFYVWAYAEILDLLGEEEGALFCRYYSVRDDGNFPSHESYHKGQNILHISTPPEEVAEKAGLSLDALEQRMAPLRAKLLEVRARRVRPGLDDKILTSWNALMITALAQGAQVFGDARYREAAEKAGAFILSEMMPGGELLRTHRKGESRLPAYLDDHAFSVNALVDLYEATFDLKWLDAAEKLADAMVAKFWDTSEGGFFFTGDAHKNLLVRAKPTYDGAEPSGNSVAAISLLRLAKLLDRSDYYEKAQALLEASAGQIARAPQGYLRMLCAVDFFLHPPKEIAIAGNPEAKDTQALLQAVFGHFVPSKVVALVDPANGAAELGKAIPLLAEKALIDGKATAYVCKDFACGLPVTTAEALVAQLEVTLPATDQGTS